MSSNARSTSTWRRARRMESNRVTQRDTTQRVSVEAVHVPPASGRGLAGRRNDPHGLPGKEPPCPPCLRSADQSVRGLLGKRVGMNRLLLLAHRPSGDGHKTEACMTGHHSLRLFALGLNHVRPIHGHRVPVGIIHEGGGGGAVAPFVVVANEVPRGDSPEQRNVVGDSWVIRKPLPVILRGCHENQPEARPSHCQSATSSSSSVASTVSSVLRSSAYQEGESLGSNSISRSTSCRCHSS